MGADLRANLWLLVLTVVLCSVLYPLVLLEIGQTLFHDKAQGSLLTDAKGNPVGSRLIAQPFDNDSPEYFQPRPSAASPSFNAAASGPSNLAGNNYLLRDRVAQQLGPIVNYAGPLDKKGKPVSPDIEAWFGTRPDIVARWANLHNASAQNWIKNDMANGKYGLNGKYVVQWQKSHQAQVDAWIKDNPGTPQPKPEDLAVPFFVSFCKEHPGLFPSAVPHKTAEGKSEKAIEPVKEGSDIQSLFFDLWLQAHPDADLEQVPADMVTSSGSGLDPDITLSNALWQLNNRVAAAWAKKTGGSEKEMHEQIEHVLRDNSHAPLGGLVGVPLVNVLEINLALKERFEMAAEGGK